MIQVSVSQWQRPKGSCLSAMFATFTSGGKVDSLAQRYVQHVHPYNDQLPVKIPGCSASFVACCLETLGASSPILLSHRRHQRFPITASLNTLRFSVPSPSPNRTTDPRPTCEPYPSPPLRRYSGESQGDASPVRTDASANPERNPRSE